MITINMYTIIILSFIITFNIFYCNCEDLTTQSAIYDETILTESLPDDNIVFKNSQPSVISSQSQHALFYWIYLKQHLDNKTLMQSVSIAADLQSHVEAVTPDDNPDSQIIAGVGFGYELYKKIRPESTYQFRLNKRNGKLGKLPASGGDIFIHAKSNTLGNLFKLCERLSVLFNCGIANASDVYGFQYMKNRDLTGFIDGTANPRGNDNRRSVAVIPETGGSFALTQRWVHDLSKKITLETSTKEAFVGRTLEDSVELKNKTESSHVARMTGGTDFDIKPQFEIVRQSMPYGNVYGEAGLFFIAYSTSVASYDFMLDQMVGEHDNVSDDIMRLSACVSGNYWYFPGVQELQDLV